jgi:ribosomal protein S18 acetylase RimI-like enzyme
MHYPTRDLKADWRARDAEKLAQLFNQSGPGWPGGLGHGNVTPAQAAREVREADLLAAFVAEADGRFVAYCDLSARPGERYAYVPFLNAHPDYHGCGFGKAVLLSSVERAIELGFDRVVLGTWPGNLKAVPLYKKSGFMWAPETHVTMENFVPFALRHALARPYFAKHNWYDTQVRDLSLHEDAFMRGKVRAYEYLWRAEGDMLRMVFDRQSWGLLEIETNELRAGCFVPDEKIIADMRQQIRWELESKTGAPLKVVIVTQPDPGIACSYQESLVVRDREVRSAEFVVDPDIPPKEREPFAHIIRSALLVNGAPLELAAGIEVRQAATVHAEPDFTSLRPGAEQRVFLHVASNLDQPARASVAVRCARGARMKRQVASLDLRAYDRHRFPITLTPHDPGQVDLTARVSLKMGRRTVRAKDAQVALRALGPRDLVGSVDEWQAVLESADLRVIMERNGFLRVLHRAGDVGGPSFSSLMGMRGPVLGPPFAWHEFFTRPRLDARIERQDGAVVAVLRSDSARRPGLLLERRVILTCAPIIEIRDTFINTTATTHDLTISRGGWPERVRGRAAMPGPEGIVESPRGGAGVELSHFQPSDEASDWPEGWLCAGQERDVAVGLIWAGATRVEHEWGWVIKQRIKRMAPGASVEAPPLYIFAGRGGPETVRSWWQALTGSSEASARDETAAAASPLSFGLKPAPAVIPPNGGEVRAFAKSFGRRKLAGRLRLDMPTGLRITDASRAIEGLDGSHPYEAPLRITRTPRARPGMQIGRAELSFDEAVYTRELPLIVLGEGAGMATERREHGLLGLDAAPVQLRVDPSFSGCAISLRWGDREMLHTFHPEHPPFMWWNPWFGGICPQAGSLGDLLRRERFAARFVSRSGRSGVSWRGIAVSCSPKHERGRHLRLGLEYLVLPGAPLLAIIVACANRVSAAANFNAGADVWLTLGSKAADPLRMRGANEPQVTRLRIENHRRMAFDPWGIVENPRARCAVLLTCGKPTRDHTGVDLSGRDGYHLAIRSEGVLQPGETSRAVFYLAFGSGAREVEPYRHLAHCADLP